MDEMEKATRMQMWVRPFSLPLAAHLMKVAEGKEKGKGRREKREEEEDEEGKEKERERRKLHGRVV